MKIYLASKSPRRRELLQQMGVDFEYLFTNIDEEIAPDETPEAYSKRITEEKSNAAWNKIVQENLPKMPVLCADTEVVLNKRILGKPHDYDDAFAMLSAYSDSQHQVITSIGLTYLNFQKIVSNTTTVHFSTLSDKAIHHYLSTGDYLDKAGAYGIQSYIGQFISKIDGCFYSVMGLPLNAVRELLDEVKDHDQKGLFDKKSTSF